jgi:hypothetical protein
LRMRATIWGKVKTCAAPAEYGKYLCKKKFP